jgi:hypothetical protein
MNTATHRLSPLISYFAHTHTHTLRRERKMKTLNVGLVLCLNIGVDPPDVIKTSPCAKLLCWIGVSSAP